jgi:NADH-quinone oxidoreductase subunit H
MTDFFHKFWYWTPWGGWQLGGMSYEWAWSLATISGILLIAFPLMLAVAIIIYAERKLWAAFALRRGPNVVGPFGVLQSFADGLKVFLQETIIPSAANRGLFLIAPIITFTVALMAWAVIPFNSGAVLANINVGLLYILAISSLGVYGVVIAGWASNSKYPFFSAMRAAAQMISYEVSIGFILICVVLWAGTFNMVGIVEAQKGHVLGTINAFGLNPLLFPIAIMFLISAMAETARAPFDLTEAESELVAGYQTEYSSMAFALYWLGEYANVLLMCTLNAVLFWGGYLPPIDWAPLYVVPGWIWLFAKIWVFFFIFAWVKATVPRYRYDQLMRLGWKVFLPISLFWVCLVSGYLMWQGHWDPKDKISAATADVRPALSYICKFDGDGSNKGTLMLSKYVSEAPIMTKDGWRAKFNTQEFYRTSQSEWGLSEGDSFALNWRQRDGEKTAYVSFSDIPSQNGIQSIWVELKQADGTKLRSDNCTAFAVN